VAKEVNFRTKKPDSVYLFLDCKWGEDQLNSVELRGIEAG